MTFAVPVARCGSRIRVVPPSAIEYRFRIGARMRRYVRAGSVMNDNMKFFSDGEAYERLMGRWSRLAGEIFLDWLDAPKELRWLDVGCGNGAFTEAVIARCAPAEVHGIDSSEAQLTFARARDATKRAQYRTGDAQALPYGNASFDVAAMALVISFVPDAAKAVAEMVRVVRPGGLVASYMWDIPGGGLPMTPLRKAAQVFGLANPPTPPGAELSRLANMQALWRQAGLDAVEARRIDIDVSFADFDDFWRSNTALGNPSAQYLQKLPPAELERVHHWLRKSLPQDASGRIRYGAFASAVKGRVPG
jgi:SAM-dependent methyltransferase